MTKVTTRAPIGAKGRKSSAAGAIPSATKARAPNHVATAPKPGSKPVRTQRSVAETAAVVELAAGRQKDKLVRDSFAIPKSEYAVLEGLKLRAAAMARPTKKSELLRAGINALNAMSDKQFLAAVQAVPSLKTGRPKNDGVEQAAGH